MHVKRRQTWGWSLLSHSSFWFHRRLFCWSSHCECSHQDMFVSTCLPGLGLPSRTLQHCHVLALHESLWSRTNWRFHSKTSTSSYYRLFWSCLPLAHLVGMLLPCSWKISSLHYAFTVVFHSHVSFSFCFFLYRRWLRSCSPVSTFERFICRLFFINWNNVSFAFQEKQFQCQPQRQERAAKKLQLRRCGVSLKAKTLKYCFVSLFKISL